MNRRPGLPGRLKLVSLSLIQPRQRLLHLQRTNNGLHNIWVAAAFPLHFPGGGTAWRAVGRHEEGRLGGRSPISAADLLCDLGAVSLPLWAPRVLSIPRSGLLTILTELLNSG